MDNYEYNSAHFYGGTIFWVIVGGIVGYLIGSSKNRPVLGLILGIFLGCIGWIIMLFVPTKQLTTAAGWYPDPYGRHQTRYFNGVSWQAQVTDNGVQSVDNIDATPPPPPAAPGQPPTPSS